MRGMSKMLASNQSVSTQPVTIPITTEQYEYWRALHGSSRKADSYPSLSEQPRARYRLGNTSALLPTTPRSRRHPSVDRGQLHQFRFRSNRKGAALHRSQHRGVLAGGCCQPERDRVSPTARRAVPIDPDIRRISNASSASVRENPCPMPGHRRWLLLAVQDSVRRTLWSAMTRHRLHFRDVGIMPRELAWSGPVRKRNRRQVAALQRRFTKIRERPEARRRVSGRSVLSSMFAAACELLGVALAIQQEVESEAA